MDEQKISGTTYLTVNGRQYALAGKITVSPSLVEREGKVGLSGVAGYSERPRIPWFEADLYTTEDLSVEELDNLTDETAKIELANGRIYVFSNAWSTGAHEIDAAEGVVSLRMEARHAQGL